MATNSMTAAVYRRFGAPDVGFFRPRHAVLGMDAAGVVDAVGGDVTRFAAGHRVIAMLNGTFGGHAEYVCVRAEG